MPSRPARSRAATHRQRSWTCRPASSGVMVVWQSRCGGLTATKGSAARRDFVKKLLHIPLSGEKAVALRFRGDIPRQKRTEKTRIRCPAGAESEARYGNAESIDPPRGMGWPGAAGGGDPSAKEASSIIGSPIFTGSEFPLSPMQAKGSLSGTISSIARRMRSRSAECPGYLTPTCSGNTYAQYAHVPFAYWRFRDGTCRTVFANPAFDLEAYLRDEMDDTTGTVLPPA